MVLKNISAAKLIKIFQKMYNEVSFSLKKLIITLFGER